MKKRLFVVFLAAMMLAALLGGCGLGSTPPASTGTPSAPANPTDTAVPEDAITIRCGGSVTDDNPITQGLYYFEKIMEERSDGKVQVEVFANCQLGAPRELIEATMNGSLDMCESGVAAAASFTDKFKWTSLPFLFPNREIALACVDGEVGQAMNARVQEEIGVVMLPFFENGYYSLINTKRPIASPADLKGMKIRTQESDVYLETFKAFGANPLPMSMTEAYTGLQQGTIDGMVTNFVLTHTTKYYEIVKYMSDLEQFYDLTGVYMNEEFFNNLPAEYQALVKECAQEAAVYQRDLAEKAKQTAIDFLMDGNMEVYFMTDDERQVFEDLVDPVYDWFKANVNEPNLDDYLAEVDRLSVELGG